MRKPGALFTVGWSRIKATSRLKGFFRAVVEFLITVWMIKFLIYHSPDVILDLLATPVSSVFPVERISDVRHFCPEWPTGYNRLSQQVLDVESTLSGFFNLMDNYTYQTNDGVGQALADAVVISSRVSRSLQKLEVALNGAIDT